MSKNSQAEIPYTDAVTFLKSKKYGLANIGISHKTSFDWRANEIYLQEKTTKARMKYSPIEYIWLLMVKELREFGLPLKSIINLKGLLLEPLNMKEIMSVFGHSNNPLLNPDNIEKNREDDELMDLKLELVNLIEKLRDDIVESMFTSMLMSILLKKEDYILFIKKDGECLIETIEDNNFRLINNSQNSFKKDTCLRIRLKTFVLDFLKKENVKCYDLRIKNKLKSVTEEFEPNKSFMKTPAKLQHHIEQIIAQMNSDEMTYRTDDGKKVSIKKSNDKKCKE